MISLAVIVQLLHPIDASVARAAPVSVATPAAGDDTQSKPSEAAPHFVLFNRIPQTGSDTLAL